jgi:RimJ/RimL family protein N-acetyltransferase
VVQIETERLILRGFQPKDWQAVLELARDWKRAPGPGFDKLPTTDAECKRFTDHLSTSGKYYAMCLRTDNKVVGLLALNGLDERERFDLGHVIHSKYQDNDYDREALSAIIVLIFKTYGMFTITTHNANNPKQLAPLKSLGFKDGDIEKGELTINKAEWDRQFR